MKNGGPAYPTDCKPTMDGTVLRGGGLTIRDYFAAAAMQSLIRNLEYTSVDNIALNAYRYSDAMLAQREKERE